MDGKSKDIFTNVCKNQMKLDACNNHEFVIDLTPGMKIRKRWQCKNCQGEVTGIEKFWYEVGREHQKRMDEMN